MNQLPEINTELASLLESVIRDSIDDAAVIRFDKDHPQQLAVVCIYCTLIELAHCELVLLENEGFTALSVVLRSMFEAYSDFLAALNDVDYHKKMYATLLDEQVRFLKNVAKSPTSSIFVDVAANLNVDERLKKLEEELKQYKKDNHKPLSTSDRFKAAGLEHEYQSVYWLLCLEGHNNISALENRHIEKSGEEFGVALFKVTNHTDILRVLDSLIALIIVSGIKLHEIMNTGLTHKYETHQKNLDSIRARYHKS